MPARGHLHRVALHADHDLLLGESESKAKLSGVRGRIPQNTNIISPSFQNLPLTKNRRARALEKIRRDSHKHQKKSRVFILPRFPKMPFNNKKNRTPLLRDPHDLSERHGPRGEAAPAPRERRLRQPDAFPPRLQALARHLHEARARRQRPDTLIPAAPDTEKRQSWGQRRALCVGET